MHRLRDFLIKGKTSKAYIDDRRFTQPLRYIIQDLFGDDLIFLDDIAHKSFTCFKRTPLKDFCYTVGEISDSYEVLEDETGRKYLGFIGTPQAYWVVTFE